MSSRASLPPWWVFAGTSVVSLVAIDVLDSDRRLVVITASVILVLGVLSALIAVVLYRRG